MNRLVEYLAEFHHPGGNSFKIVPVIELMTASGFSVEEVHEMALEASMDNYVLFFAVEGERRSLGCGSDNSWRYRSCYSHQERNRMVSRSENLKTIYMTNSET